MKNEFYKDLLHIFETHEYLRNNYDDLHEVIKLINKAIELQEEINEVNKKLNELNQEKKEN